MTEEDNRVALIGVIVENPDSVEDLNMVLHDFREWILGRMGIPYKAKDISVISVAMDAPADVINSLSGKLGRLDGVSAKTIYSKNNI